MPVKAAGPDSAPPIKPHPTAHPHRARHEAPHVTRATRYREIFHEVKWALLFTGVLVGLNLLAEKTEFGERLKLLAYNAMQHRLPAVIDKNGLPIAIVDITRLPGTFGDELTSRKKLTKLIDAIGKAHPRAIGLDIDCSPQYAANVNELPILTEDEGNFYKFCHDLSTQPHDPVPVFLGVDRTATSASADWLWKPEFAHMAVALRTPTDGRFMMWKWIDVKGVEMPLKSISAALAEVAQSSDKEWRHGLPHWLHWALEAEQEHELARGVRVQRPCTWTRICALRFRLQLCATR